MERRQQLGRAEARRLQYVMSILSTLPQHRRAGMTRVGRATVRELGMKGAVTVDAETQCQLDVKGHTGSSTKLKRKGRRRARYTTRFSATSAATNTTTRPRREMWPSSQF